LPQLQNYRLIIIPLMNLRNSKLCMYTLYNNSLLEMMKHNILIVWLIVKSLYCSNLQSGPLFQTIRRNKPMIEPIRIWIYYDLWLPYLMSDQKEIIKEFSLKDSFGSNYPVISKETIFSYISVDQKLDFLFNFLLIFPQKIFF
jgi:hypothetical protein